VLAFGESKLKKRVIDVMKYRKYSIAAITVSIVLLIVLSATILTGATNSEVVESPAIPGNINTSALDSIDVKNKVDQLLKEIVDNGPVASSNPYDYIKNSKAFDELVAMGNPALEYMFDSFAKSNEDGLKEYVMASACAKIMGTFDEQKGIGVPSGRDWFYKYGVFEKDADFHIVDADYDLFEGASGKPKLVLPEHTDMKNMEDVISNCILSINRRAYRMGEKAIEVHKIYRTEEK